MVILHLHLRLAAQYFPARGPQATIDTLSITRPRQVCSLMLTGRNQVLSRVTCSLRVPRSPAHISECQISFGLLVATNTANIVAVLRILSAIASSAFDTDSCCFASSWRRVLTLWSWSTSFRMASKIIESIALLLESLRAGGL